MFIISVTEKELALALPVGLRAVLPSDDNLQNLPSQASDEAQGWGGAQTHISLRSKAGVDSILGKQPNGNLEQRLKMSHVK